MCVSGFAVILFRVSLLLLLPNAMHRSIGIARVNDRVIVVFFLSFNNSFIATHTSSWEKNYDPVPVLAWMSDRPWIPILACVLYGAAIWAGQAYFETRNRWHWRTCLAFWNAGLSAFSALGLLRTAPQLVHNLMSYSVTDNLCLDPQMTYGSGSTGLWVQLFILSKFP